MCLTVRAASPETCTNMVCRYVIYYNSFSHIVLSSHIVFLGRKTKFTSLVVFDRFRLHSNNCHSLYLFL